LVDRLRPDKSASELRRHQHFNARRQGRVGYLERSTEGAKRHRLLSKGKVPNLLPEIRSLLLLPPKGVTKRKGKTIPFAAMDLVPQHEFYKMT
jgi:hypothetical protein